jgi:hypothetical protein
MAEQHPLSDAAGTLAAYVLTVVWPRRADQRSQRCPVREQVDANPHQIPLGGAAVAAGLTACGTFKEHIQPGDTTAWLFVNLPIIGVATAVIFGVVVRYALRDPSGARAARTALILSFAGVATTVVFYLGLDAVLAGAATCCALAARRGASRLTSVFGRCARALGRCARALGRRRGSRSRSCHLRLTAGRPTRRTPGTPSGGTPVSGCPSGGYQRVLTAGKARPKDRAVDGIACRWSSFPWGRAADCALWTSLGR